jgi:hypothetical protein
MDDLTKKTDAELEAIIRRAKNTNLDGSLHQRAEIEIELRDKKSNRAIAQKKQEFIKQSSLGKKIKRGSESWGFLYSVLGILLAIETFIIGILPMDWNIKIIVFIVIVAASAWLCLLSAWFQNELIGLKIKIEEKWRDI